MVGDSMDNHGPSSFRPGPRRMMRDDLELFERWSDGDVIAGQELVNRHYETIFFFFASKLPDHLASDLTQETFETMCAKTDSLHIHTSFSSYLLGIARWKLVEFFGRRARRKFDPITESFEGLDASPSITSLLGDKRRSSRLVMALRKLPLDDQILLELQTYEALQLREIAEILGVSHNRIATRLATAKRRLRRAAFELPSGADTVTSLSAYMKGLHDDFVEQLDAEEDGDGDGDEDAPPFREH